MRTFPPVATLAMIAALTSLMPALAMAARRGQASEASTAPPVDVPFTEYRLQNGLRLVVHEDHANPIAASCIWYHVGSKNEKPGKTGFAHLFEHLMFNGSENHQGEWFEPFESVGATDQNGTTNTDRTNYFQTVPKTALEMTLWLESDRMGHLLGAIDQAKLDEQRGVVQNEKRQGENQPYGRSWELIAKSTYPEGHGYSWTTIGSMDDLNAASLDDVKDWFRTSYGPGNAVLVVTGDVNAEEVHAMVERLFGDIPPGPPVQKPAEWIARMTGTRRAVMEDRVPQPRLTRVFNIPGWGKPDNDYLDVAADVLSTGKTSRLFERLVYRDQVATDVRARASRGELGGQFSITVTAKAGQDLLDIEKRVDEEMGKLMDDGPTTDELMRIKTMRRADLVERLEKIGGFGGRSQLLAESTVLGGSPDAWKESWARVQAATPADVSGAMKRWLTDGDFILHVVPFGDPKPASLSADRSHLPDVGMPPPPQFPGLKRAKLDNGLSILLAERHDVPMVQASLVVDAGYAADQQASPGTSSLTLDLLDEGTARRDALAISNELGRLGADLSTSSNLDVSQVTLSALRENLEPSLDVLADVVLNPAFAAADFERLKAQRLAAISREKSEPNAMAMRVMPRLVYGEGHAYATPFSGTGTEAAVSALSREDVVAFHQRWFRPNNATLVVAGDVTLEDLQPLVAKLFGAWPSGDVPGKSLAAVKRPDQPRIFIVDKPGAVQSLITAAEVAPPKSSPDDLALETMNRILGGSFSSRINMNLREDKHWSYGARSSAQGARGQRPFYASAPVQTDKTAESLREVLSELRGIRGERPITEAELKKAKDIATLTLAGRWETTGAVLASMTDLVRFGLDDSYWGRYPAAIAALQLEDVERVARDVVAPDAMTWVVVGDRAKIEAPIRALAIAPVEIVDADGNPVDAAVAAGQ
jgi:zinc protease